MKSRWYDRFAPVYDIGTVGDAFYRKPREVAINKLEVTAGSTVADVFCGTGVDFPRLAHQAGDEGVVMAVDGSEGMLERARSRSKNLKDDASIHFYQADFSQPEGVDAVESAIREMKPKHIFFSLGLTCLKNWYEFFLRVFNAAPSGARFAVMDVYNDHLTLGARFINWIGAADCRRRVWQVLEERCESFEWDGFRPFKVLDVSVIVAAGKKP